MTGRRAVGLWRWAGDAVETQYRVSVRGAKVKAGTGEEVTEVRV